MPAANCASGCLDAARILARLVAHVSGNGKLTDIERARLTRTYVGRTIVLLREVIDTDPKLADQVRTDADITALQSRTDFQTMMNTLVNLKQ